MLVEEFDDGVDPSRWERYHNTYGDGNAELACLTPDNVTTDGGILRIEARREPVVCPNGSTRSYSSGFLGSREVGAYYPLYGRYAIRARVPHGQGLWPAFWLRHAAGSAAAEVDVIEIFHSQRPGTVTHTLHFAQSIGRNAWSNRVDLEPVAELGDWHDFAVEILPDATSGGVSFSFSVDGEATGSFVDVDAAWRDLADPLRSWDIAVNLAVGGTWVGDPARDLGWLGGPRRCSLTLEPSSTPASCPTDGIVPARFPAVYEVDRIEVSVPS